MFNKRLHLIAGASVALIILVDLATGQGPTALNSYLGPPPPPQYVKPSIQMGYMQPRGEYEPKIKLVNGGEKVSDYGNGKEEKYNKDESSYGSDKYSKESSYDGDKTTPAPGVFASFQNSMSDAWKSLTNLGRRSRRSVGDISGQQQDDVGVVEKASASIQEKLSLKDTEKAGASIQEKLSLKDTEKVKVLDEYELRHQKSNGYIFMKVPRKLVCNES